MSNIFGEDRETQIVGGGYGYGGGFGSSWCVIIVVLLVAWLLFKDGGHRDGYGGGYPHPGYGFGGGCAPCVQPTFKDESNWEQEYHLCKELNCVDKDVIQQGCLDREATHCEGEKTRDLIRCEAEKQWMYKLNEKDRIIQTLESNAFTERKIDQVLGAIGGVRSDVDKQFCRTDAEIARLSCELPKRPPVFAECVTPNTHDIDCRDRFDRDFPRRGRCHDGFGFDGCCA